MIKGQDVIILLLLRLRPREPWTYEALSRSTGMSTSQCHSSQKRLRAAGLLGQGPQSPWHVPEASCVEFLLHGLKYVLPPKLGPMVRGIPTAHSAHFVAKLFADPNALDYVWPDPEGNARGTSLEPLHSSQLRFAPSKKHPENDKNQDIYEMLATLDLIRVGRARERNWAADFIKKRIHESA